MSNVLVISTSLRGNSNSERLTQRVIDGARDAGHQVESISLKGKEIKFCIGCLACQHTLQCVQKDDAVWIAEKVKNADTLVFSTPIYYYEMSGQMKTLLDRANSLYGSDYKFTDIYMLTTAAEDEAFVPQRAVSGLQGWIDCFEKASLGGSLFCGGLELPGQAAKSGDALEKAYQFGKALE